MNTADGQYLEGVYFSKEQLDVINKDIDNPKWGYLNPPQIEEYESDRDYFLELRNYADRIIGERQSNLDRSAL